MSDDIVARLREPCSWVESTHTRFELDQERAEAADEIERLRAYPSSAFVLKEGELLVVKVPDWLTSAELDEMVQGLPEGLRQRTVLLRACEAVRGG